MTKWHKINFLLILQKAAYRQKQTITSRIDTKLVLLTKISCIVSRLGKKLAKIWNISKMIYIYSIFRKFNQISMLSLFVQFSLWHFYKLIFSRAHSIKNQRDRRMRLLFILQIMLLPSTSSFNHVFWNIFWGKSLLLLFHYFLLLYLFFYVSHKIVFCEIKAVKSFLLKSESISTCD